MKRQYFSIATASWLGRKKEIETEWKRIQMKRGLLSHNEISKRIFEWNQGKRILHFPDGF